MTFPPGLVDHPANDPFVVVVWRSGCRTCQYALPYWQRLADANPTAAILGVCQDDPATLAEYCRDRGITFSQRSDSGLRISRALKVSIVPSYWLVGPSGDIILTGEGWDRSSLESINRYLGGTQEIIQPNEDVVTFKPG